MISKIPIDTDKKIYGKSVRLKNPSLPGKEIGRELKLRDYHHFFWFCLAHYVPQYEGLLNVEKYILNLLCIS